MVMMLFSHVPVTPGGKPENTSPSAPVVEYLMLVTGELIQAD